MSHYYFEASALVKRYISEKGSTAVLSLTDPQASHTIFIAEITRVEIAAALAGRHRMSVEISRAERDRTVSLLLKHCDTEYRIVSSTARSSAKQST